MPLYLLWGDEDFNLEMELNAIKATVLDSDINPLNYKTLDNPPFADFDEALRAQPMMFGPTLCIIKADKYLADGAKKYTLDDKQTAELIKSMENISDTLHIVLLCKGKKPDSRRKLYKAIDKIGITKGFERFKPWEDYKVTPWVKSRAAEKGLTLSQGVISKLIQNTGVSLRDLDNNLEKLKLLTHPEKNVTDKMVWAVDEIARGGDDIFSLCDVILKKDYTNALYEISKLLEKSHYLEVLAFLQSAFTKLLQIKTYSKNLSTLEMSKKVGQHEFVVKKNLAKLSGVSLEELVRLKLNLTDAEFRLKTGENDPLLAFERAFLKGVA
jgi:DNA polymerase-3 subunit delta